MIDNRKTYYHSAIYYVLREKTSHFMYFCEINIDGNISLTDMNDDVYLFDTRERALQYNKEYLQNKFVVEKMIYTISMVSLNEYKSN